VLEEFGHKRVGSRGGFFFVSGGIDGVVDPTDDFGEVFQNACGKGGTEGGREGGRDGEEIKRRELFYDKQRLEGIGKRIIVVLIMMGSNDRERRQKIEPLPPLPPSLPLLKT